MDVAHVQPATTVGLRSRSRQIPEFLPSLQEALRKVHSSTDNSTEKTENHASNYIQPIGVTPLFTNPKPLSLKLLHKLVQKVANHHPHHFPRQDPSHQMEYRLAAGQRIPV
jgi:hypothetical protein